MIVHHIVTMFLLYFSWVVNFVRIGTLVLLVHDAADFPMAVSNLESDAKENVGKTFFTERITCIAPDRSNLNNSELILCISLWVALTRQF